jgi:SOS-response transcriptional repressor LexA
MVKSKGGAGKGQGRKLDWGEKTPSRISVPDSLTDYAEKRGLVKVYSLLKQDSTSFAEFALALEGCGVTTVMQPKNTQQTPDRTCFPLYHTAVAASFGLISTADAELDEYEEVDLNHLMVRVPERTYLLKVMGKSMIDDGINPGSILVVEGRDTRNKMWIEPKDRDIVIALINGTDLTVKRFRRTEQTIFLEPRNHKNKDYQPLFLSSNEPWEVELQVEILGIVRSVTQFFRT